MWGRSRSAVAIGSGRRKVVSLDGDPPGNDTTIQAAPAETAPSAADRGLRLKNGSAARGYTPRARWPTKQLTRT